MRNKGEKGVFLTREEAEEFGVENALREKRMMAMEYFEETGELPEWWNVGISMLKQKKARKFQTVDEYISMGVGYFEKCVEKGEPPTLNGLILALGFTTRWGFLNHARRNPEFRDAQGAFLAMLSASGEHQLRTNPKGQSGTMFWLKNIPEGFDVEDSAEAPIRYGWKDRQQLEVMGEDGGAIRVSRDLDPFVAYRKMLEGGMLEEEEGGGGKGGGGKGGGSEGGGSEGGGSEDPDPPKEACDE